MLTTDVAFYNDQGAAAFQPYNGKYKFLECESDIALICLLCDHLQREYSKELLMQELLCSFSVCVKAREIKVNLLYKSSSIKLSDLSP